MVLTITHNAGAEGLQITMPNVSGADLVEQGAIDAGIARLEQRSGTGSREENGAVHVALCGAFTVKGYLAEAISHCDAASSAICYRYQ